MISSYITIALRNLTKNKLFSVINISGMAISLASCFLIALFVWDELQFDQYHPNGDRTYRVYNVRSGDDGVTNYLPIVPNTFGPYLQKDFPEIESTMRLMDTYGEVLFESNGRKIMETGGVYAEPTVFDMLSIPVLAGDAATAMSEPNTIALSAALAKKYFGDKNPIGEMINVSNSPRKITAVYEDMPSHSHLHLTYVLSFVTVSKNWNPARSENWVWQQFFTYLRLKPGTRADELEAKFPAFIEKYALPKIKPEGFTYMPHLQNIGDIYLHSSNFEWEVAKRGNAQTVYVLSGAAIFILIIACLNFVNLSTARSMKRMKEVGVRKVAGAHRGQLVLQFISESVVISIGGLALALITVEISLPYLNGFSGKELVLSYSPLFAGSVILFSVLLGTVAGSYPAFYLSGFRPALVLYNKNSGSSETAIFRHGLVVLQFMFSFFLIMGSLVVISQNDMLRNKDLGFHKEQLVSIELHSTKNYETTKQEFLKDPNVLSATVGFGLPGDIVAGDGVVDPRTGKNWPANLFIVDHDYIRTLDMHLAAGRDFSRDIVTDSTEHFIINETAARTYGFTSNEAAIGQLLEWNEWNDKGTKRKGEIIGVVKDFHFKSLREQMTPVVMTIFPRAFWKITLRIRPENAQATVASLKNTYERLEPEWPFSYKFLDASFDAMYRGEQKLSGLISVFTGLAIIVACLGLFGLVEYSVSQRSREISIRKVFGASVNSLLLLLTRKYFLLVAIAFVVIIPVSYYAAQEWLNTFAYHITLSPWMYAEACGLILAITALTVTFQSLRAAGMNPASTLRNE